MGQDHRIGDKVALKDGSSPARGVIVKVLSNRLRVQTAAATLEVSVESCTNFSAAARKAWSKQPHRQVGRPRGAVVDRVTVNVRLDRDMWDAFKDAEKDGLISGRTDVINRWLREGLNKLRRRTGG